MTIEWVAPWVALGSFLLALALLGAVGRRAWRTWRRTRVTQEAAAALLDVHRERLDAALDRFDERRTATDSTTDELRTTLAELRADVDHLRWTLRQVPDAKARLGRELGALLVPGRPGGDHDA